MAQLDADRWMRLTDIQFSGNASLYHHLEEILKSHSESSFSNIWFTDDQLNSSWRLSTELITDTFRSDLRYRNVRIDKQHASLQLVYQASSYESLITSFGLPAYYVPISELLTKRAFEIHESAEKQLTCSICLLEKSCFFQFINNSKFEKESTYKIDKQDDVLYYLMLLLKKSGGELEDVSVYLSGRGSLFSSVEKLLSSYLNLKNMDVGSDALHYPELKYLSRCAS